MSPLSTTTLASQVCADGPITGQAAATSSISPVAIHAPASCMCALHALREFTRQQSAPLLAQHDKWCLCLQARSVLEHLRLPRRCACRAGGQQRHVGCLQGPRGRRSCTHTARGAPSSKCLALGSGPPAEAPGPTASALGQRQAGHVAAVGSGKYINLWHMCRPMQQAPPLRRMSVHQHACIAGMLSSHLIIPMPHRSSSRLEVHTWSTLSLPQTLQDAGSQAAAPQAGGGGGGGISLHADALPGTAVFAAVGAAAGAICLVLAWLTCKWCAGGGRRRPLPPPPARCSSGVELAPILPLR